MTTLKNVLMVSSHRRYVGEMWNRRAFILALSTEKIRTRHQDTLLGGLWHLLNPLLTVAVYFVVFGGIFDSSRGIDNFLAWLSIGIFAYRLTSTAATSGSAAITANEGLIRSLRFPRATLPISVVIGDLYAFRYDLYAILVISTMMGVAPSPRLLIVPLVVLVHALLNSGIAFFSARLGDAVRDFQQFIPFVFRLMQFLSGVVYPISRFANSDHQWAYRLLNLNPVVHVIEMYRWCFLGAEMNSSSALPSIVLSLLTCIIGFRYFVAGESRYGRS